MKPSQKKRLRTGLFTLGLLALTGPALAETFTTPTVGQCQRMTNLFINNSTGYDINATYVTSPTTAYTNFVPYAPNIPAYGSTGFMQVYQSNTTGTVTYQIQDGITNPSFNLSFTGATGGASALNGLDNSYISIMEAGMNHVIVESLMVVEVPVVGEVILAFDALDVLAHFLVGTFKDMAYYGVFLMNSNTPEIYLANASLGNVISLSDASQVIVVAQQTDQVNNTANITQGYVVGATAFNANSCPNFWMLQVVPYCDYICANNLAVTPGCDCPIPPSAPPGSYQNPGTCESIQWNPPTLSASCQNESGGLVSTTLNYYGSCVSGSTVSNINGQLTCDD